MSRWRLLCLVVLVVSGAVPREAGAHEGPPYPIISNQIAGRLRVSVWTDPDTTDDGSKGGQFWVMVDPAGGGEPVPTGLHARVSVHPLDRSGPSQVGDAEPVNGDPGRRFVTLNLDHEGRFAVRVELEGAGLATVLDAEVQATYDLRPPRALLAVYALPFILVGVLWTKLLLRRRRLLRRAPG